MSAKMTMVYWKGEKFWLGMLKEHPEIMTQGRTVKELEENLKDAYHMMIMDDVPEEPEIGSQVTSLEIPAHEVPHQLTVA